MAESKTVSLYKVMEDIFFQNTDTATEIVFSDGSCFPHHKEATIANGHLFHGATIQCSDGPLLTQKLFDSLTAALLAAGYDSVIINRENFTIEIPKDIAGNGQNGILVCLKSLRRQEHGQQNLKASFGLGSSKANHYGHTITPELANIITTAVKTTLSGPDVMELFTHSKPDAKHLALVAFWNASSPDLEYAFDNEQGKTKLILRLPQRFVGWQRAHSPFLVQEMARRAVEEIQSSKDTPAFHDIISVRFGPNITRGFNPGLIFTFPLLETTPAQQTAAAIQIIEKHLTRTRPNIRTAEDEAFRINYQYNSVQGFHIQYPHNAYVTLSSTGTDVPFAQFQQRFCEAYANLELCGVSQTDIRFTPDAYKHMGFARPASNIMGATWPGVTLRIEDATKLLEALKDKQKESNFNRIQLGLPPTQVLSKTTPQTPARPVPATAIV